MKKSFNFKYEFSGKGEILNFDPGKIDPDYIKMDDVDVSDAEDVASFIESRLQLFLDSAFVEDTSMPIGNGDLDCTVSIYPVQDDED